MPTEETKKLRDHGQRMGRKMPYTSADGAPHPKSFWCLGRLTVDIDLSQIQMSFVGYHSAEAYDDGRVPITGAVKEYYVYGADFAAAITQATAFPSGSPISAEILGLAWRVAMSAKDVVVPPAEEGGEASHVSFFEQADNV